MKKTILKVCFVASMVCAFVVPVSATEELINVDDSNYIEVQSGGEEERKINDQIIASFDETTIKQTRGWGESCYPDVPVYKQETNYYCGPACLQMALKHITGTKYSQSSLASTAGTNSTDGTYVYKMRDTLNAKQSTRKYAYTTVSSQSDLQNKVTSSIAREAPVIFHAKTGPLQMYNGKNLGHYVLGHTIYEPASESKVYIAYNDPWDRDYGKGTVYGTHTDTLQNFYKCLTQYGDRYLIYAS